MKVLAIIPARAGSKGIPGKNIKKLGNKPLIAYVIEDALKSKLIDKVVVSTDSQEIANVAKSYGAEIPFLRPAKLAADNTPSVEVVKHALNFFLEIREEYDVVCLLQPTSPFKPLSFICNCIEKFKSSEADSLVSLLEVPHEYNPHWTFEMNDDGGLQITTGEEELIPRRQELPKTFHRDGSVYIMLSKLVLNETKLVGGKIIGMNSDPRYYANLDTLKDWIAAEKTLSNLGLCAE